MKNLKLIKIILVDFKKFRIEFSEKNFEILKKELFLCITRLILIEYLLCI